MRFKHYIVVIVLILIANACETNTKWENYGGYKIDYDSKFEHYIVLDKVDTVLENYPYYNQGVFIKIHHNDYIIDTVFVSNGGTVIETYIDDVVFDDFFILVDQKPLEKILAIDNPKNKQDKNEPILNHYDFIMDRLKKSNIHDYWIIVKESNEIYGPLTKGDYLNKRKKLNIPSSLKLKSE